MTVAYIWKYTLQHEDRQFDPIVGVGLTFKEAEHNAWELVDQLYPEDDFPNGGRDEWYELASEKVQRNTRFSFV